MILRPYQTQAVTSIEKSWEEFDKVLCVMPTGTGKTRVFSELTKRAVEQGGKVLILAHRQELISQAVDKLHKATGLIAQIDKAEEKASPLTDVVVGSIQTLMRDNRLTRFPSNHFGHVIHDESHHLLSVSHRKVVDYFKAKVCGFTATAERSDKKNLGQYFQTLAFEYSMLDAIHQGWLCPITAKTIPLTIDLTKVRTTAGDYNDADLGMAIDPYLEQIVAHIPKDRKTLIFLPLIQTSEKMTALLNAAGHEARHICGVSKDRKELTEWYATPGAKVMCNSMLWLEGFDQPDLDCICVLRATRIRSLYCQAIGRGTRISPGKQNLLILDFLWHTAKHDIIHPASLTASTEEVAKKMTEIQEKSGGQINLLDLEKIAHDETRNQREEALARQLKEQAHKKANTINPIEFALSLHDTDLEEYEPIFPWQMAPATDKQLVCLEKFGFDRTTIQNKGFASMLMDKIITRRKLNLATPKMVRMLGRLGAVNPEKLTFNEARTMLDIASKNRWRLPKQKEEVLEL